MDKLDDLLNKTFKENKQQMIATLQNLFKDYSVPEEDQEDLVVQIMEELYLLQLEEIAFSLIENTYDLEDENSIEEEIIDSESE